jgi:hypothetical protein
MFGKAGRDFDPRKVLKRDFDPAALEFAVYHLINVRLGVVNVHSFPQQREHAAVFSGDDGNAYIHVGQQAQIMVVERAGDLADVARAAEFDGGRNGADSAVPDASGQGVPGDFDFLAGGEAADVGFVDEGAHQHPGEIPFLQQQVSGLHVGALLDGKRVDDAVEGSAHAGFCEGIFGGFVGGLGFRSLRLNLGNFRLGVAVFLLLLEQGGVGLGALEGVFGLLDLTGGGCALLLEAPESVEIALGGVARTAGFDEFGIEGEKFFPGATCSQVGLIGLRCFI